MRTTFIIFVLLSFISCTDKGSQQNVASSENRKYPAITETSLVVLGTIQDAGSPQIACTKNCCKDLFIHPDNSRKVVCLGIIDPQNKKKFMIEATPDMVSQLQLLNDHSSFKTQPTPDGILLTHAHIGHYTGLMYLGKEAMNANHVPVYAMPRMKTFLEHNGPWSQLVNTGNIEINELADRQEIMLTPNLKVTPFTVPHRDEYSETVGYKITGPHKKVLFIPDIDKWEKWDTDIIEALKNVDYAFLDATFYDGEEINNRDISEIPHPFVIESMAKFNNLPDKEKQKICFIHFNHTNPLLVAGSQQNKAVKNNGFNITHFNDIIKL